MTRKFLVWPDGTRDELPLLTYNEFYHNDDYLGTSDIEYGKYLSDNGFSTLDQFDETDEDFKKAKIILID